MEHQPEKFNEETTTETKALSVLLLAVFIDILGFGIILPLLPFWVTNLGSPEWVFGLLL